MAGFKVAPHGNTVFVNEAFQVFASRWMPDAYPVQIRREFMAYLRTQIRLVRVLNRPFHEDDYVLEPATNAQDLGGGNIIVPYSVKEDLDLHLVQEMAPGGTRSFNNTRVY